MFDFLKKSRAVKFLCSACLLCSLGSFVNVNAEENDPVKVAEAYVRGQLGMENERISFENDSATINGGQLSGTLTWKTGDDTSGYNYEPLENAKEDAKLTLFLVDSSTKKQVAVTDVIDLGEYDGSDPSGPYNISEKFYAKTNNADGTYAYKEATDDELFTDKQPRVLEVFGIVTDSGDTTLISGPTKT
jgi:hypothetical protein